MKPKRVSGHLALAAFLTRPQAELKSAQLDSTTSTPARQSPWRIGRTVPWTGFAEILFKQLT
jgi:hypothetical protein